MTAIIDGTFVKKSGKFWELRDPTIKGGEFDPERLERNRPLVVAVYNPKPTTEKPKGDFRLKCFLAPPPDNMSDPRHFTVKGFIFNLPLKAGGHYEGDVDSRDLHRLINNWPPIVVDDEEDLDDEDGDEEGADEYLDACIETRFEPPGSDAKDGYYWGDVSTFPRWMNASSAIKISPPSQGGYYQQAILYADSKPVRTSNSS